MDILTSKAGSGKYIVDITAIICGEDICVSIFGGTHPHIGAVALALPRVSLSDERKTSASVSVLTVLGHKEDDLAKAASNHLACVFRGRVSVQAGLHVDNATQDEIKSLWTNYEMALADIESKLTNYRRDFYVSKTK